MDFSSKTTKSARTLPLANTNEGFPDFNEDKEHLQKSSTGPNLWKAKKIKKKNPFDLSFFQKSDDSKSSDNTPFKPFLGKPAKNFIFGSSTSLKKTSSIFGNKDKTQAPMKIQSEQQQQMALKSVKKCKGGQVTNTISGDYLSKLLFDGSDVDTKDTEF